MLQVLLTLLPLLVAAGPVTWPRDIQTRQKNETITVKLPYATYKPAYDSVHDIYTFKNIRFGAKPEGKLRFAKPAPPEPIEGIQDGSIGGSCLQGMPPSLINSVMGSSLGGLAGSFMGGLDLGLIMGGGKESEDCLFLDVIVPGKAIRGEAKLPVVNWIYGGAYVLGSKGGMYDGTPLVKASKNNIIFVGGNYRLGSLGFLAGTTVESNPNVTTNAGFYDQRAVLKWIQNNIHLFGGIPAETTIMGESAGGGSIVHHLTAYGGKRDPLFKRAIIQSPGFDIQNWDRAQTESTYQTFLKEAGCLQGGIPCLQSLPFSKIKAAQESIFKKSTSGFLFGPSVDGKMVRQLPQLEFAAGASVPGLESIIITHMSDEASLFTPKEAEYTDTAFTDFTNWQFGNSSTITAALLAHFPLEKYPDGRARTLEYSGRSSFTCTNRGVANVYPNITWMAQIEGQHGGDISMDFYDADSPAAKLAGLFGGSNIGGKYQDYLASYVRSGDPNKFKSASLPEWPTIKYGAAIENVLEVNKGFKLIKDLQTTKEVCDLFVNVYAAAAANAGTAPPGSVVPSTLTNAGSRQASVNYGKEVAFDSAE